MTEQQKEKIKIWLNSGKLPIGPNTRVRYFYRDYIEQEQNNRCAICGLKNKWNKKSLVFVLDHIDGNATNNARTNLRMVCPNCDSQLPTFKSKNKKSARTYDKAYRKLVSKKIEE